MDPVNALGLGLGAASLAIQLFDGAIKGFKIFEEAVNADRDCEAFRLLLLLQYERLENWGRISGLNEAETSSVYERQIKSNGPLVVATLSELSLIFKSLRKTELRLSKFETSDDFKRAQASVSLNAGGPGIAQDLSATDEELQQADVEKTGKNPLSEVEQQTYLKAIAARSAARGVLKYPRGLNNIFAGISGLAKVSKNPKRFIWAVHDKERFKERLSRVRQLVDFLQDTLRGDQIEALVDSMKSFRLLQLQIAHSVEGLKIWLEAQTIALPPSAATGSSVSLSGTTAVGSFETAHEEHESSSESRFLDFWTHATQFSIAINSEESDAALESSQISAALQTTLAYTPATDPNTLTVAEIGDKQPVWIEWKLYNPTWVTNDQGQNVRGPSTDTRQKVERLVSLLQASNKPAEFCVPKCLGYFDDAKSIDKNMKRFGIIYQAPTANKSHWPPQTLLSYFRRRGVSLSTRISIAQWISNWLLYLHTVNWLHKGLRSASVLFFADQASNQLGQPYITGFEFSRTGSASATSTGPPQDPAYELYTHPKYLGLDRHDGFRKTYDIYSLGIILIEIAHWKPINEILGIKEVGRPTTLAPRADHQKPPKVRDHLLADSVGVMQHVKEAMGDRYHDATRACIDGMPAFGLNDKQDQFSPTIGALLQRAYVEIVVDPLKSISI